jgi:NAD-dependent dihydropyrimidine dehydrogenase PreA subunit
VADKHNCGVCEEVCPVPGKAIRFRAEHVAAGGGTAEPGQGQELRLPVVIEDACVGCGFCEYACPVLGQAAIRVTGGYAELPPPSTQPAAATKTASALPVKSGDLRLSGPKKTYAGVEELRDYIDGEADLYAPFGFVRVTAAGYTDGTNQVSADVWEFQDADGAFGAYAKDRQGEPATVGDEGSQLNASVWAWRGRFTVRVVNLGQAAPQQTLGLAQAAVAALDEKPAPRPEICRRLPQEGLEVAGVLYMRDDGPLWNLDLAEKSVPDGTFAIAPSGPAAASGVAAYGTYKLRSDSKRAGLLLISYPDEARARDAATRLADARARWGNQKVAEAPYQVFKAAADSYGAVGTKGSLLAAAFYMPTADAAVKLLGEALR